MPNTAGTVDLASHQQGKIMTSDSNSDPSFRERVEEIREERNKETKNKIADGNESEKEVSQRKVWAVLAGIGIMELIGFGLLINGNPGLSMIIVFAPFVVLLLLTEDGRELLRNLPELIEEYQQHQSSQSRPKRICSSCGWQNPQENNFCHDCGSEFGKAG